LAPLPPRQAGASQLLRVSPPARPASVLRPARCRPSGNLPLATSSGRGIGTRLLTFRTGAADQAHVASMPGTTWPVNGHPPGSSRDYPPAPVSMPANLFRHVNGYNARLPDPRLTHEPGLLPPRSPRQSSANAAVGGLKPPPAGRLRRANNPSSPAQHHLEKLAYHAPFSVRDTRGSRLNRRLCSSVRARYSWARGRGEGIPPWGYATRCQPIPQTRLPSAGAACRLPVPWVPISRRLGGGYPAQVPGAHAYSYGPDARPSACPGGGQQLSYKCVAVPP
jgi:hypothetical protein